MSKLTPPLSVIEDRLFDPSPVLIRRWIIGDPSLSSDDRQILEQNDRARFLRDLEELPDEVASDAATEHDDASTTYIIDEAAAIPPLIDELHRRRVATRDHFESIHDPAPGQMRLFERAVGPEGPLDWDMNTPLAVLLWRPTQVAGVWEGWMLASETDYATDLDILLEPEDEPYDGRVAMVQIWNKVECYVHSDQQVIGQLHPDRLRTMVLAFADYALPTTASPAAVPVSANPGTLIDRVLNGGKRVLCGTPLGDARDVRHRYQALYGAAADLIKQAAKLAVVAHLEQQAHNQAAATATWLRDTWGKLIGGLQDLATELGGSLTPVAPVAVMSGDEAEIQPDDSAVRGYRVAGLIQVECLPNGEDRALKLRLTRLAFQPVVLKLILDGDLLEQHTLDAERQEAILFVTPEPGLALLIQDPSGVQHRWTLAT